MQKKKKSPKKPSIKLLKSIIKLWSEDVMAQGWDLDVEDKEEYFDNCRKDKQSLLAAVDELKELRQERKWACPRKIEPKLIVSKQDLEKGFPEW